MEEQKRREGRPSKYDETIINKTHEYLESCVDREYQVGMTTKLDVKLPSIAGLAVHLKVSRETVHQWRHQFQEFSDIISDLLALQEQALVNSGLSGKYNSTISKLILTKHGYFDRVASDHSNKGMPFGIDMSKLTYEQLIQLANKSTDLPADPDSSPDGAGQT